MTPLRKIAVAAALIAVVWFAVGAVPAPLLAQSSTSPPTTTIAPDSSPQRHNEMGVWHHFGEGQAKAAAAPTQSTQSSGWHHFGETENAPTPPRGVPTWQTSALSRTQQMERQMFDMVNRDRADPANTPETNGRAFPLQWNDQLAAVARAHSLDMMRQGYFDHQDPQGKNVAGRVEAAGIQWQALGENIAISGSDASAQAAFMNEPKFAKNHRANILSTTFTEVGIGIVQSPDGRLYITQDFYTPPAPR